MFKGAGSSPLRRRALKRLLSDAEKPETCRKAVRQELDRLKVKGARPADERDEQEDDGKKASEEEEEKADRED